MKFNRFCILVYMILSFNNLLGQRWITTEKNNDTIPFNSSQLILTKDTVYLSATDSFVVLRKGVKYRIKKNPYNKSEVFYDSLKVKSYRSRMTEELYRLLIKSTPIEVHDTSNFNKSGKEFLAYNGLKIKSIRLKKVDVIEGSIHDTMIRAQSFLAKRANDIHVNSSNRTIYNSLTIKAGDRIDVDELADNERILRSMPYIEDARIFVIPDKYDKTTAELLILTKDEFSVGIGAEFEGVKDFRMTLYDKNFLGVGHDMRHSFIYHRNGQPDYGYAFSYNLNNIAGSFISAGVGYEKSWERELTTFSAKKSFLSPRTKYAGGLSIYRLTDKREYDYEDTTFYIPYSTVIQDVWGGRSFPLFKNDRTRLLSSLRYFNVNFTQRPEVSLDSNYFYRDRNMLLAELSLMDKEYYKSSLVMGFGVTEDIPYGYVFTLKAGYETNQFSNRPYVGGGLTVAHHLHYPGYILGSIEIGSFFNKGKSQDGIIKLQLMNIGRLHTLNRYKVRSFVNMNFQYGFSLSDPDSKAQLNNRWTSIVSGLNKKGLKGTQKLSLNLESDLFTPWYLIGFKFSLFAFSDMGWVSSSNEIGKNTSFYSSVGTGFRIKNESWIFETFTIGFSYFLRAPKGSSQFGFLFDASDPRLFRNLNPGKPETIKMDSTPGLFVE